MTAPASDAELFDLLRLARADGVGPRTFATLLARHGSAARAIDALEDPRARRPQRPITLPDRETITRELEAAGKLGIRYVALGGPLYPARLAAIDGAPTILSVRGRPDMLGRASVAIVGARNASAGGLAFAERLARGLGAAGYATVSGLARGIDGRVHRASLATGTIAVLAGGLDRPYPPDHADLFERIVETGAAISEMPVGWQARGRDFPRRNRIVSGLAMGTIIVEAARRSGSLITARCAADQGREVFAVPGSPLDPRAEGPNELLRDGATFCTSVDDVVSVLAGLSSPTPAPANVRTDDLFAPAQPTIGPRERPLATPEPSSERASSSPTTLETGDKDRLLALLGPTPVSLDVLVRATDLPVRLVRALLLELDLEGRIQKHAGDLVSRTPS